MTFLEKQPPSEKKLPYPDLEVIEDRDYPNSKVAIYICGQAVDFVLHGGTIRRIGSLPSGVSENTEIYRVAEKLAEQYFEGLNVKKMPPLQDSQEQKLLTKEE